jgi:AcrR family transcriptional regulator
VVRNGIERQTENSVAKRVSRKAASDHQDQRIRRSKEAVLKAAYELLIEKGLSGLSVDEVSERSGVAKTTIYRHWSSRSALVMDACSKMGSKFEVPDSGTLEGDLLLLAREIAGRLRSKNYSSVLPSVIDAAERDPEIASLHSQMHAMTMAPLYTVIEGARQRRELPRSSVPAEIVAAIVGPLFYRRWFSRETLDDVFVKGVVQRAIRAAR